MQSESDEDRLMHIAKMRRLEARRPILDVPHVGGLSLALKGPQPVQDRSAREMHLRHEREYRERGLRRVVEALIIVHDRGHPHLVLQRLGDDRKAFFRLPGGALRANESELSGMQRKLRARLMPDDLTAPFRFNIRACVSTWWQTEFDGPLYPYLPPHCSAPKEVRKLFLVEVPPKELLVCPGNYRLVAVPFMDLHDSAKRFGTVIAAVPTLLSNYEFRFLEAKPEEQQMEDDANEVEEVKQSQASDKPKLETTTTTSEPGRGTEEHKQEDTMKEEPEEEDTDPWA
ncbi:MAG: hypothetical protein MHM6MM_002253 [Cercozoa sp. M6MM]